MSLLPTRVKKLQNRNFPFGIGTLSLKTLRNISEMLEKISILVINEACLKRNVTVDRSNLMDFTAQGKELLCSTSTLRSFLGALFDAYGTIEDPKGNAGRKL